jgi:hypothetical protein
VTVTPVETVRSYTVQFISINYTNKSESLQVYLSREVITREVVDSRTNGNIQKTFILQLTVKSDNHMNILT